MEADIIIIGGGIAGLTAGLYGARAGRRTVIIEHFLPGGQTATIRRLENYPGFIGGVEGNDLTQAAASQCQAAGCETWYESVSAIVPGSPGQPHRVLTDQGERRAPAIIIATGATPSQLGLADEERLIGRGVSYCATCDGALFRGKIVAVVGGGDTALTDALVLAEFASQVWLIHRRQEFRGSPLLQSRVAAQEKIQPLMGWQVAALLGENKLIGLSLVSSAQPQESREVAVDGLFIAVGVTPQTAFLPESVRRDEAGRILTGPGLTTSVPGIFAAGDCRDTPLRQVVTAAADGAIAATSAVEYLLKR